MGYELFLPFPISSSIAMSLIFREDGQDIAKYAVMVAVILIIVISTIRLIGNNSNCNQNKDQRSPSPALRIFGSVRATEQIRRSRSVSLASVLAMKTFYYNVDI